MFNHKYGPNWATQSHVTNINHNQYNFRENKCIPFFVKELLIPSIERNTSQIHLFWKIPSLVGSVAVAMVIVINYVIGGLS